MAAEAQPIDPWLAEGINRSIREGGGSGSHYSRPMLKPQYAKFYGALAMTPERPGRVTWAAGSNNEGEARADALKSCGLESCQVVRAYSNTCGMLAGPKGSPVVAEYVFAYDSDPERAIDKAYEACEKAHGEGKCRYAGRKSSSKHSAFCVGYKYGVYSTD